MIKQFVRIGNHIINVNQIAHIFRCDDGSVEISLTATSTLDGELEGDYVRITGKDAEIVLAYFSSMLHTHTLIP